MTQGISFSSLCCDGNNWRKERIILAPRSRLRSITVEKPREMNESSGHILDTGRKQSLQNGSA